MNQKTALPLLFAITALCAGSITLNIMQASSVQDPNFQKAKTGVLSVIKDTRRTGTVVQNNSDEGWMLVSLDTSTGQPATYKIWLVPHATITRVSTATGTDGVITTVSVLPIEQTDLRTGEMVYVQFTNSPERNRLEAATVTAGDLLPLTN